MLSAPPGEVNRVCANHALCVRARCYGNAESVMTRLKGLTARRKQLSQRCEALGTTPDNGRLTPSKFVRGSEVSARIPRSGTAR
jgi:hypothetical protein